MAEAIQVGSLVMLGGLGKWCWLSGRSLLFEAVLDGRGALRLAMTGWGGDVGVFRHCEALAEAIHGGSLVMLGGLGKRCWLSGRSLLFEAALDGRGALRLAMTGWGGDVGVFRHCEALAEAIHGGSLVMLGGLGKRCWLSGRSLLFEAALDGHGALRLAMTGWGDVAAEVFRHCEALAEAIHGGSLVMLGCLGKLSWLLGCSSLFEAALDGRGALRLAMTGWGEVAAEVFRHCEALAEAIQVVFESINRFFPCLQRVYLFEHDWRRDQSCLMMPRSLSSSMTC